MNDSFDTGAPSPEHPKSTAPKPVADEAPRQIGRYQVRKILGKGGFGIVYLANDEQLDRLVAIKVPHRKLIASPEDAHEYLLEARTVAKLDHPNIVPVFDVGGNSEHPCFIVSKFIEGSTLARKVTDDRASAHEVADFVATIAEALHYAHSRGVVHRDIKPGNILLDTAGKPYVADFGLALKEENVGKGPRYAGTPAYMSPEQARGEGHRVDGRSDIFSLGVVFYELLTGRRPFRGESTAEVLEQISTLEPRPPRQWDDSIPKELERICFKALSKRSVDRFSTGKDMADDLWHFLAGKHVNQPPTASTVGSPVAMAAKQPSFAHGASNIPSAPLIGALTPSSDSQPIKIVPKGLRSFDAHEADFFLELLPGPRDRNGLPDSIRFWKTRIEEKDLDSAFAVGLIYGPSGCGKSSLVKAGLLPRLSGDLIAVYVEAAAEETEARLLKEVRRQVPHLPANLGLIESLAALRRGRFLESGSNVLLVLDQFEQWLHAKRNEENTELVQALRHCDGGRLQCVVMVRDDFWLSVSRFMKALEVEILEGRNSALVDLFDLLHARKVLAAFGQAYGRLPDNLGQCSKEQDIFLDKAVAGLAQESKVISVRLALFAEMVKGKLWTPATLKEVGGTEGVGVTFLEETFTASTAPPPHRLHQKAAQAVLKALLPEAGTDIKGHMRSRHELLESSGYAGRPRDFDDLIRILDGEIRLITPTDPEGKDAADTSSVKAGAKYYQLTHDYLVPSLREWLSRKQMETRRGRAQLLLADRTVVWMARPDNRQLPSILQWCSLLWLTRKKNWTLPQRKMMHKANMYHLLRGALVAVLLALLGWGGYEAHGNLKAHALLESLLRAETTKVPTIVEDMKPYRHWLDTLLEQAQAKAGKDNDRRKQLHASLALLPVAAAQVNYLYGRLLDAEPGEVPVIRDALLPHKEQLVDKLWSVVASPEKGKGIRQRLRAAAALANYDPESGKWAKCSLLLVNGLVLENTVYLGQWSESFRPVRQWLLPPLCTIFRDHNAERAAERTLATNLLVDYAADQPEVLADLLMDADDKQFVQLYPLVEKQGAGVLAMLTGELDKKLPSELPSSDERREKLAKRQANAAVALLRMNQPDKVWPLLKHSRDPRVRSYLAHRLSPLGADAGAIIHRLETERDDISIRRALLLSLGEYGEQELPLAARHALVSKLRTIYCNNADAGLHASAEWLLRRWKQKAWLKQVNEEWAKDKELHDQRLDSIKQLLTKDKEQTPPQWYVNGKGHTMVVIPGPVEFMMGSPPTEVGRLESETQHKKRIGRTFAIAAKPVTMAQILAMRQDYYGKDEELVRRFAPGDDCPAVALSWHDAAEYCNWLSAQEGIDKGEQCYEIKNGMVTKLKANYLSLTGYRLPTEAELEFAIRARAVTARFFGETEELLPDYAWYQKNSREKTWPVGTLKPNDFGLFDAQGSVFMWCQDGYKYFSTQISGEVIDDAEDVFSIVISNSRVLHGGSYDNQASAARSASRNTDVPTNRMLNASFRLARTLPLVPLSALPPTPEGGRK